MIQEKKWEILNSIKNGKDINEVIDILLENRGIKTEKEVKEFLNPTSPEDIQLNNLAIDDKSVNKAIKRIEDAIKSQEKIIIYGDYDADGVCATAILWETIFKLTKNVSPYIPDRFSEGYGIKSESVSKLKEFNDDLKLIITVDNGIVANEAIEAANKLGIDVIITDHHQLGLDLPKAYSIIHTDKICGSGISWFFSREIIKHFSAHFLQITMNSTLELAAIGTIADQLPLIGPNRSIAKYGLTALNNTNRLGLQELFAESAIKKGEIGTYAVNYLIAPRLNAMGRITHAIDSLRLICTNNVEKAKELAQLLAKTNRERQTIVEEVVIGVLQNSKEMNLRSSIVISGKYHEGVIGLAAGKLVERFYRPSIVLSEGEEFSKASARSITGFNIIEAIRKLSHLIEGGGGHPMAAGFSIKTINIASFISEFEKISAGLLTDEILLKKLKIDLELPSNLINDSLIEKLKMFEPTGIGNPPPVFSTNAINVKDARTVGSDAKHLKLNLEKDKKIFPAIAFGMGDKLAKIKIGDQIDVAFSVEENIWNGNKTLQLKVKDIQLASDGKTIK